MESPTNLEITPEEFGNAVLAKAYNEALLSASLIDDEGAERAISGAMNAYADVLRGMRIGLNTGKFEPYQEVNFKKIDGRDFEFGGKDPAMNPNPQYIKRPPVYDIRGHLKYPGTISEDSKPVLRRK